MRGETDVSSPPLFTLCPGPGPPGHSVQTHDLIHLLVGLNEIKFSLSPYLNQISKNSISFTAFLHLPPIVQELQGLAQPQRWVSQCSTALQGKAEVFFGPPPLLQTLAVTALGLPVFVPHLQDLICLAWFLGRRPTTPSIPGSLKRASL